MEKQTNTTRVTAPDIVCGGCAGAIKKALGNVEGVNAVEVDVETKAVTIEHAPDVSREKIVETLDRAGFPAS
jgi:copper chaperone CopZ